MMYNPPVPGQELKPLHKPHCIVASGNRKASVLIIPIGA